MVLLDKTWGKLAGKERRSSVDAVTSLNKDMRVRLGLWLGLAAALALLLYRSSLEALATALLSPQVVVQQGAVHPWGVLGLCLLWLWMKRRAIRAGMGRGSSPFYLLLGLAYLVLSRDFFPPGALLLGSLGLFAVFFGPGAFIPSLLMGIYAFAVAFPLAVEQVAADLYASSASLPAALMLTGLGYQLAQEGQVFQMATASGETFRVWIAAACAGPATMAVFVATFALMSLDVRLPWRIAVPLFLFGMIGTWLQAVVRIVLVLLVGYYWGEEALWGTHLGIGYALFSVWYLLFAYIYLTLAGRLNARRPQGGIASAGVAL